MIFISHKNNPDHDTALRIANTLEEAGIHCWLAPESIPGGRNFAQEIPQAINSCELFLLVLSKEAMSSAHVFKEINLAISHKKKIIPLKIGDFDLDDVYEYMLGDIQIIPFAFTDEDTAALIEQCKLGERVIELEVAKNPSRKVTLIKGGYQENMAYLIDECPEEIPRTVFAMGMDRSSRLDISSNKGILKWVCIFLKEEYGITLDDLQELINEAKQTQLGHKTPNEWMQYKDCILIKVPIRPAHQAPIELNFLLVANSCKNPEYEKTHDPDAVEGIDSREIIIAVFNKFRDLDDNLHNLLIGAMGTNGLSFPYEVAISEILNCYIMCHRLLIDPQNLYLSIRNEDMARADLTVEDILNFTTMVVNFVKE